MGTEYESLEHVEVCDHADGSVLALMDQANAGIVRRDLRGKANPLREMTVARLLEICAEAAERFMEDELPPAEGEATQSPADYVAALSSSSGLPHTLCRANMDKVRTVLSKMDEVLRGLTRGMDLGLLDHGVGEQGGVAVSLAPNTDRLGVVLPSNSPGVNSIWLPAVALKTSVVLKPGREEPWTPLRIVRALVAAGAPAEAFGFYPTDHEGAAAILAGCDRAVLFGDERTTAPWAADPTVSVHGPGHSKVVIGPDESAHWKEHLDLLVESVAANGGRSCVNASTILVCDHGDEIAEALARRLADLEPRPADDPEATLCAFANPAVAENVDAAISREVEHGAEDVSARLRSTPRLAEHGGGVFLRPTVVRCDSPDHPLARTEYLFPFTSVVEVEAEALAASAADSLVVTAVTRDPALTRALIDDAGIGRLNLGPQPTTKIDWGQPHEGNLFELLYTRRAISCTKGW
jgi:acyl-CoA reductase-like NAD-dependent aldehyde dehydrogenase